jgi:hypothetical protein
LSEHDDEALGDRVRAALAADEPRHVPPFDRVWANAAHARSRPAQVASVAGWALAAAIVLGIAVWVGHPDRAAAPLAREPGAAAATAAMDRDYVLAVELAATFAAPSPVDRLTAALPPTVARGLPLISDYRYPLLPEEIRL